MTPYNEVDYAQILFDKWKIGKKGKDNGVIILLVLKERRWRIHTGYGVEAILTDALCSRIGREQMVPLFKEGRYQEGLYRGVSAVAGIIAKDSNISLDSLNNNTLGDPIQQVLKLDGLPEFLIVLFMFSVLGGPILIIIFIIFFFSWVAFWPNFPFWWVLAIIGCIFPIGLQSVVWAMSSGSAREPLWKALFKGTFSMGGSGSGSSGGGGGGSGGGGGGGGSSGGGGAGGGF
jgi:uncharacterized protein